MKTFDEKLKDYFEKLKLHPEIVTGIINHKNNSPRAKEVVFGPQTETELLVADSVTTYFIDIMDMFYNINEIETPSVSELGIVDFYVSLIKAFKNGDSKEIDRVKKDIRALSPEEAGELLFDSMLVLIKDPEDFMYYIKDESGVEELEEFVVYYDMANGFMNGVGANLNDMDEALNDPEALDFLSRFIGSFDSKYQHIRSRKQDKTYAYSYKDQQQVDPCRCKDKPNIKM